MTNLLKTCLGEQYENLAQRVKEAHLGHTLLEGYADVQRGNFIAQIICVLTRMPKSASNAHFIVDGKHFNDRMEWNRLINNKPMNSTFARDGNLLVEKLGFIHMSLQLSEQNSALNYSIVKTKILGIPIPHLLAPRVYAREAQENGDYVFQVEVSMPLVGLLIKYAGTLKLTHQETSL